MAWFVCDWWQGGHGNFGDCFGALDECCLEEERSSVGGDLAQHHMRKQSGKTTLQQ